MKILLAILLFPFVVFSQVLPPGKYLKVKDDGSGFELFTLNAITSGDTAGASAKILSKYKSDSIHAALTTLINGKSATNHNHAYNTLTGLPTLFDGNYNSLTNKPTIPTNNNQLTNGNSFLVAADIAGKLNTNGSAAALTNFPAATTFGAATGTSLAATGNITSSGGGIGYVTGNGGAVVQATNKSTTVVLNKLAGTITLVNSALAASTTVTFTLTNSTIAATDVIILNHTSGGTAGSYTLNAQVGAGSATINVRNVSLASLSEAIVIRYAVIKSSVN